MVQWTYWNDRYKVPVNPDGSKDQRANATMEGCFDGTTCDSIVDPVTGDTETLVFTSVIEHWFYSNLDYHGTPYFETTSTYEVLSDGSLQLTRSILRKEWPLLDINVKTRTVDGGWHILYEESTELEAINYGYTSSYLEGWSPFRWSVV